MLFKQRVGVQICTLAFMVLAVASQDFVKRTLPVTSNDRVYLKEGEKIELKFEASGPAELRFNTDRIFKSGEDDGFRSYPDSSIAADGVKIELTISSVSLKDNGQYVCALKNSKARQTFNIFVVNVTGTNDVLNEPGDPVTIGCASKKDYTIEWYKNGKKIPLGNDDKEGKYNISKTDNSLTIISAYHQDVGQYDCVVYPDAEAYPNLNVTGSAFVRSAPFIAPFERSKNLVQGDTLKITCKAYGYPVPSITWFKILEDETEKPITSAENRTNISSANNVPNSLLKITDLVMEDAGNFVCVATNVYNATREEVTVRVKDKYAALWPFLGIVVEVVILCVIIFIYEKKRSKRHEEDDSPDIQKTNSHDHKAEDLRQRNKNPKA